MEVVKNDEENIQMESTNETPMQQVSEMDLPIGDPSAPAEPLKPIKIVLIGTEEPLSSSTLEAISQTFVDLGETVQFGVMQPKEVKAYINAKNTDAEQKSMDDFLKDENNVKRAEALAKKLDGLFKTEGKWCNIDKLVKMITWNKQELLNNLMSLQTFGFVQARKTVGGKLLIQFILTDTQRNESKANDVRAALSTLKEKLALVTDGLHLDLLNEEIKECLK